MAMLTKDNQEINGFSPVNMGPMNATEISLKHAL